jgi:hypothetical protein
LDPAFSRDSFHTIPTAQNQHSTIKKKLFFAE